LRISGNVVRQELEGDKATEVYVLRLLDHTHAAAHFLDNAVMRNGLTDQEKVAWLCGKRMRAKS
jgi:hypothetical protein